MLRTLIFCIIVALATAGKVIYREGELALQEGIQSVIKTKQPLRAAADLPKELDYRKLGLLTIDLNQHIPQYCGSCWAHAAYSTIADRMKILSGGKNRDIIPAVQTMINCGNAGSCNGGDSHAAFAWTHKNGGVPDVTCQQYRAENMQCTPENTCQDCSHDSSVGCFAVPEGEYPKVTISEFGGVSGEEAIMSEILERGPVAAYIDATCIEDYTGGINMYDTCRRITNHAIQLNGWGEEEVNGTMTQYWIGRNSWGRHWGEDGFFRIVRGGRYDPKEVYWAVPEVNESL